MWEYLVGQEKGDIVGIGQQHQRDQVDRPQRKDSMTIVIVFPVHAVESTIQLEFDLPRGSREFVIVC